MDPLTLTSTILTIATKCISITKDLNDVRSKYSHASLTIIGICTESSVCSTALYKLQALLIERDESATSISKGLQQLLADPLFLNTCDQVLTGCTLIFSCLDEELGSLRKAFDENVELNWKQKAKTVWKETTMQELLNSLRGQMTAMNLLLQSTQMETVVQTNQLLMSQMGAIDQVRSDIHALRITHPAAKKVPESILSATRSVDDLFDDGGSTIGHQEFSFDDEIVNSKAYRAVLASAMRQRSPASVSPMASAPENTKESSPPSSAAPLPRTSPATRRKPVPGLPEPSSRLNHRRRAPQSSGQESPGSSSFKRKDPVGQEFIPDIPDADALDKPEHPPSPPSTKPVPVLPDKVERGPELDTDFRPGSPSIYQESETKRRSKSAEIESGFSYITVDDLQSISSGSETRPTRANGSNNSNNPFSTEAYQRNEGYFRKIQPPNFRPTSTSQPAVKLAPPAKSRSQSAEPKPNPPVNVEHVSPGMGETSSPSDPVSFQAPSTDVANRNRMKRSRFGNYFLGQTVGENRAKVKLAWKRDGSAQVVIKLYRKEVLDSFEARVQTVYNEVRIMRDLDHPRLVRLHEMVETERYFGVVLEYSSGGELGEYINTHRYLQDAGARRLFAQLVSGIGWLHSNKIAHLNIDVSNVLLDKQRNILIVGFGKARRFDEPEFGSEADFLASGKSHSKPYGTPEKTTYTPPEILAELRVCYPLADVWGMGAVLYTMLAGLPPWHQAPMLDDTMRALGYHSRALTFPEHVTPHARDLLRRMLVLKPAQRANMSEVARHSWLADVSSVVEFLYLPRKEADAVAQDN